MTNDGRALPILHLDSDNADDMQQLGPYRINTLIKESEEGAGTVYRVHIEPNQTTNTSYHRIAEEYYFILSGNGTAFLDGEPYPLKTGDFLRLPPGTKHSFRSGDNGLEMLDIHTPGCRPNRDTYFVDETPSGFSPPKETDL